MRFTVSIELLGAELGDPQTDMSSRFALAEMIHRIADQVGSEFPIWLNPDEHVSVRDMNGNTYGTYGIEAD